jgi:hypothetical protein
MGAPGGQALSQKKAGLENPGPLEEKNSGKTMLPGRNA